MNKFTLGLLAIFSLTFLVYSILPLLVLLFGLFLYKMRGSFKMNLFKKLAFIFKSNANKTLDQFLDAQQLSLQIKEDLEKSIFKLTNSLTEVNESRIRLTNSKQRYLSQIDVINSEIKFHRYNGDEASARKLASKAIQYNNLVEGQSEAIERVTQVQEQLKGKIRDMHDTKSEVEVAAEVLQAEYETFSTLNSVSAHGSSTAIRSDALEMLKTLAQRSKTEYLAKAETEEFTKQFDDTVKSISVSSNDVDEYIKNLK